MSVCRLIGPTGSDTIRVIIERKTSSGNLDLTKLIIIRATA